MRNTQEILQEEAIQEAAILAVQAPRLIEIISILIEKAEQKNKEDGNLNTSTDNLVARLRPVLYGLDMRAKSLSISLSKAGYGKQIDIADKICEVL